MIDSQQFLPIAIQAAISAGKAIMHFYATDFEVEYKSDESPLTIADKSAHQIIAQLLESTGLPLLSEEGKQTDYSERKNWHLFWLIDPLDGTKEFIKKNGDFTVNIALIENSKPILGVIFAPVYADLYFATANGSFHYNLTLNSDISTIESIFKNAVRLPHYSKEKKFVVVGSRSHMNIETEQYINKLNDLNPEIEFVSRGSSLKFCTMAEGLADEYPRFGPTMEWDTAAGHAIATFAGCTIVNSLNNETLVYNKPDLLNPFFIVKR